VAGLVVRVALVFTGYAWGDFMTSEGDVMEFVNRVRGQNGTAFVCELVSDPQVKGSNARTVVRILKVLDEQAGNEEAEPMCLVYFRKDSAVSVPHRGDVLVVSAGIQPIAPPLNPGEFDFRKYMSGKDVYLRTWLDHGDWKVIGHREHFLKDLAARSREYIYERLKAAGIGGQELELAASLLLGQKDGLEQDTRQSFSAAGAMHVLCVSGLHVGIIYVVLNFFFKGLYRIRYGRMLRFLLVILFIWFYALMTGMSPSVMRASLMFSFLQAGRLMKNPPPTINSLASSAFILAVLDPLVITNIGFQFSYFAVLAILGFVSPLQSLWQPGISILGQIWSLVLVSLAAQLGTGPLSAHYFHQFPVWFLLTNLMVIPLASIILYLALAVIVIPFAPVYGFIGHLLSFSLKIMLGSVRLVEELPGALISSINLSGVSTVLIYSFLVFLILMIIHKSRKAMFFALFALIAVCVQSARESYSHAIKKEICIYHVPGHTLIDLVDGNLCYTVHLQGDIPEKTLSYSISPGRQSKRLNHIEEVHWDPERVYERENLYVHGGFLSFYNVKAYLAGDYVPEGGPEIQVDVAVITGDYDHGLDKLLERIAFNEVVIDSSVPPWNREKLESECDQLGIHCHSVSKVGCYSREIRF
jgi:competence protein ComEC